MATTTVATSTGSAGARRLLLVIAGWQCAFGIILASGLWLVFGSMVGSSALIGAGIAACGSASMAAVVGFLRREASPKRLLYAFVLGEVLKFAVTVALFAAVVLLLRVAPLSMLGTFVAAFVVYWVVLIKATSKLTP